MILTIDMAGRLVIPKPVRERLGLTPGARLRLEERNGRLELEPVHVEPDLVRKEGFLVIARHPAAALTEEEIERQIEAAS
jgi:AbrB family looped-hinge helix DNA binding protein